MINLKFVQFLYGLYKSLKFFHCSTILNDIGCEGTTEFSEQSEKQSVRKLSVNENTTNYNYKVQDETSDVQ